MLSVNAAEQHLVYLLNRARHDPATYEAETGLALGISSQPARPPLAVSDLLMTTASFKAEERATEGYTGHQSTVGEKWWPNQLVREFGYDLPDAVRVSSTEVIPIPDAGGDTANSIEANAAGTVTAQATLNAWLASSSHRALLLGAAPLYSEWREVGVGYVDDPSRSSRHFWTAHAARTTSDTPFLTGVVFADGNSNGRYDQGEGLPGVTIRVGSTEVVTNAAGGWAAGVAAGEYLVTASGGAIVGRPFAAVTVGDANRAVDFISGQLTGWVDFGAYVNTAPILDASSATVLPPVLASSQSPSGFPVAAITATRVTDPDPASRAGLAVTGADATGLGEWQYSINGGGTWHSLGAPSASAARLLRSTDRLRFLPSGLGTGSASLTFRAWDETVGSAGSSVDPASLAGGSSAFSVAAASGTIAVVASNAAPVLDASIVMRLPNVPEDSLDPAGTTVAALIAAAAADAQPGSRLGVAVIGGGVTPNGTWQWQLGAGQAWADMPSISPAAALMLAPEASLRFLPKVNFEGSQTLQVRAWDLSDDRPSGTLADLSSPLAVGGTTGFSTSVGTILAAVSPVNDAPRIDALASAFRLHPVAPNTPDTNGAPTTRISDLLGNSVSDIDVGAQRGVALVGGGGNGTFWLKRLSGGWATGPLTPHSPWLLFDTDEITFIPNAGFSGTVPLVFRAWDRSLFDRKINNNAAALTDAGSSGGTTAFSSELITATLSVGAAGPAPSAAFEPVSARLTAGRQSIAVEFSTAVSGVDIGDFLLTRDGEPVSLVGATVAGEGAEWRIEGVGDLTHPEGMYVLTLLGSGTGIASETGMRPAAGISQAWEVDRARIGLTNASLNENAVPGTVVGEVFPVDPEPGQSFTYSLVAGDGDTHNLQFAIADGTRLVSTTSFDYESVSSARIRVRSTQPSGEFTERAFRIRILNIDEAAPQITSGASAGTRPEDTPLGTLLYQVTATDDGDVSSGVSFSLAGPHAATFTIDPATGAVRLARPLDFETTGTYQFIVRVTDGAGNRSEQLVTLLVTNVDEHPIDILLNPAFVSKTGPSGTLVGTLTAVDPDGGKSYSFDLAGGHDWPDNGYFYIAGNRIYSHGFFRFVDRSVFTARVRVRDGGSIVFEKTIPIIVTDGNAAPTSVVITEPVESLPEDTNLLAAVAVGNVLITDDEIGWHSISLSGPDAAAFEVIENVLYLKAGTVLDHAQRSQLTVRISVSDTTIAGSTPVGTDFTLTITPAASAPPPRITGIHVRGSLWNAAFEQALEAAGVGLPGRGYRLPDGVNQLANASLITWSNVNQVVVEFDTEVTVTASSLSLIGPGNAVSRATGVTPIDGRTYRWTVPTLDSGKYVIVLESATIQTPSGTTLDGEWTSGTTHYGLSGDGVPGGDLHFRFQLLRADLNRNGGVNLSDVTAIRTRTGLTTAANYRFDVNASGSVTAADITLVRGNNGRLLANFIAPEVPPPNRNGTTSLGQPNSTSTGRLHSPTPGAPIQSATSLWHLWAAALAAEPRQAEDGPNKSILTLPGSR